MARTWYHDVLDDIRDQYDLGYRDALAFYQQYRDLGYGREDWGEVLAEEEEPEEPEEVDAFYDATDYGFEYDVDDYGDYWLEEGEELEFTVYYGED